MEYELVMYNIIRIISLLLLYCYSLFIYWMKIAEDNSYHIINSSYYIWLNKFIKNIVEYNQFQIIPLKLYRVNIFELFLKYYINTLHDDLKFCNVTVLQANKTV